MRRVRAGTDPGWSTALPACSPGLTLVELLIALAILVTVMTSTWLIFQGITRAWRTGELRSERYQQARLLSDLFVRELSSCIVNVRYPFIGNDAGGGPPVKSGSTQDELFFVGALPGRSGLVERGYWVSSTGHFMCYDHQPADGAYTASGSDELCGSGVAQFDVSYFDGTGWLPQWDGRPSGAQAGQIPKAIRLTLTIGNGGGESFETVVSLPTS